MEGGFAFRALPLRDAALVSRIGNICSERVAVVALVGDYDHVAQPGDEFWRCGDIVDVARREDEFYRVAV